MQPVTLSPPLHAPSRWSARRPPLALAALGATAALLAAGIGAGIAAGARTRSPIDPADPGGSAVVAVQAALARAAAARRAGDEASALRALDEASELVATTRAAFHPLSALHLAVPRDPRTGAPRTLEAFQAELDGLERTIEQTRRGRANGAQNEEGRPRGAALGASILARTAYARPAEPSTFWFLPL